MKQLAAISIFILLLAPCPVFADPAAKNSQGVPISNDTCLSCHSDPAGDHFVDAGILGKSLHGGFNCTDCHTDVTEVPHAERLSKVNCGACHAAQNEIEARSIHGKAIAAGNSKAPACTSCHGTHAIASASSPGSTLFWQNIPATCGTCHDTILKAFNRSVHGQAVAAGKRDAPVCTDCHNEHSINAVNNADSPVSPAHITDTCSQCHSAERITTKYRLPDYVVGTYMGSYHGLSNQRGSVTAANCASCHNSHDILPRNDPDSSINPKNLRHTCGQCHAGIGEQVINGKIHSGTRPGLEDHATTIVRNFYIVLFILVLGMMILHNGLDLATKIRAHYRRMSALDRPVRMEPNARGQHFILLSSFILLAWSGFALKFPQAWWSAPFLGTFDWRGLLHRAAAGAFMLLAAYHGWYLLSTPQGRHHLKELLPCRKDFDDFTGTFAYYFGKRPDKPRPGFYGYVEKIEYWALVWGSVIMALSGLIMMQKEYFLQFFPKWVLDAVTAVHYYEAILACLAIILWHWYFVIIDPDIYPMKCTWLNGKAAPADDARQPPRDPGEA